MCTRRGIATAAIYSFRCDDLHTSALIDGEGDRKEWSTVLVTAGQLGENGPPRPYFLLPYISRNGRA